MSKRKKVYAVSVGVNPGIYDTWEECKAQVDGFSGAKYKSFATQAEAHAYLGAPPRPQPRGATTRSAALKRKREEESNGDGDEGEEGEQAEEEASTDARKGPVRRQTKLIASPFFSSSSSSSSSSPAADLREKKRVRTGPAQSTPHKSTTLQKFFEENNLQTKKWVDKDWIVANWK